MFDDDGEQRASKRKHGRMMVMARSLIEKQGRVSEVNQVKGVHESIRQ